MKKKVYSRSSLDFSKKRRKIIILEKKSAKKLNICQISTIYLVKSNTKNLFQRSW
jgi:hypothetical protein